MNGLVPAIAHFPISYNDGTAVSRTAYVPAIAHFPISYNLRVQVQTLRHVPAIAHFPISYNMINNWFMASLFRQ